MPLISQRQLLDQAAEHGYGVLTFNINTDCRRAMSGAMRKYAREYLKVYDPRKFILAAMEELKNLVHDRFERFGAAGHGASIRAIPLANMAQRYEEGVLDPCVTAT